MKQEVQTRPMLQPSSNKALVPENGCCTMTIRAQVLKKSLHCYINAGWLCERELLCLALQKLGIERGSFSNPECSMHALALFYAAARGGLQAPRNQAQIGIQSASLRRRMTVLGRCVYVLVPRNCTCLRRCSSPLVCLSLENARAQHAWHRPALFRRTALAGHVETRQLLPPPLAPDLLRCPLRQLEVFSLSSFIPSFPTTPSNHRSGLLLLFFTISLFLIPFYPYLRSPPFVFFPARHVLEAAGPASLRPLLVRRSRPHRALLLHRGPTAQHLDV